MYPQQTAFSSKDLYAHKRDHLPGLLIGFKTTLYPCTAPVLSLMIILNLPSQILMDVDILRR